MVYRILVSHMAVTMLKAIRDRRIQQKIADRINSLTQEPENQGKRLGGEFVGCRRVRAVGRYRIIYKVDEAKGEVLVLVLGIRKKGSKQDIYQLARKLIQLGLVERRP